MLPGFPSFTGFHFVCIGFYQVLPGFTGFYWVFLGFTLFVSDFSRFYRVLLGFHGFCQVSSGFTVFDWVELDFIWLYQAEIGGSSEFVAAGAELWLLLPSVTEWTATKPWDWSWYRTGHLDNRLFHWIVYSLKFFFLLSAAAADRWRAKRPTLRAISATRLLGSSCRRRSFHPHTLGRFYRLLYEHRNRVINTAKRMVYLRPLGCFYRVSPSFYWVFTEFYIVLPSFTAFYWVLPSFIVCYRVL